MCRFFSKDFALQACNRFSWHSRHVSLVRRSNRQNARAPTIQYWVQENRGKTQSRNEHLAPTSPRCSSTTPQRGRPGVDPLILRQRRLVSRGDPLGSRFRAVGSLARGQGRIGHFKGVGSFLGQAGGHSERSRRVRMAFVRPRDSLHPRARQPRSPRTIHRSPDKPPHLQYPPAGRAGRWDARRFFPDEPLLDLKPGR